MSKKKTGAEMILDMLKQYIDGAETEGKENYPNNNCEDCEYWDDECDCCDGDCDCCDGDCDEEEDEEEHTQTEELSKFITSIGTVLSGDMGLLVFDKSNKKDMEKLAVVFGDYAKRL